MAQAEAAPSDNINDGNWHQIFCVYNSTNVILYVDGNQYGNIPALTGNIRTGLQNVGIGARSAGASKFNGSIDEVMIFNRGLSASEIQSLYNSSTIQYYNNFTNLSAGSHNFAGYAVDTAGSKNQTETRTVTIDLTPPAISLTYPLNTTYNSNISSLNYTASDNIALSACWYSTNGGKTNATVVCGQNLTGLTSTEGSNTWLVGTNDTAGNMNSSKITFFKDTINPSVSIVYPANTTYQSITALNYTVYDSNLQACWYSLNSGQSNTTVICGNNVTGLTAVSGSNTWTVYANDTLGNVNSSKIIFSIDNTPPSIIISSCKYNLHKQ